MGRSLSRACACAPPSVLARAQQQVANGDHVPVAFSDPKEGLDHEQQLIAKDANGRPSTPTSGHTPFTEAEAKADGGPTTLQRCVDTLQHS